MARKIDMVGRRAGRLLALREFELRKDGKVQWVCSCDCGNETLVSGKHLRHGGVRSCGCLAKEQAPLNLPDNTRPIGFKRKVAKGYIEIKTERGFVREHVYVMEMHLGRRLLRGEVVHHKDENKSNNALSNLEVMTHGDHTREHHTGVKRDASVRKNISKSLAGRSKIHGHIGRKLTEEKVVKIRELCRDESFCQAETARLYGVTRAAIRAVIQNKTWVNV